jgi:hypothetical protein
MFHECAMLQGSNRNIDRRRYLWNELNKPQTKILIFNVEKLQENRSDQNAQIFCMEFIYWHYDI